MHEGTADDPPSTVSVIRQKGADIINESSRKRRHDVVARAGQTVHKKCRLQYNKDEDIQTSLKAVSESPPAVRKRSVRVCTGPHNCRTDCLFCGCTITRDFIRGRGDNVSEVKTDVFPQTVLSHCEERSNDWSFTVKGRIAYFAKDLHAAECIYHQQCSVNFRSGRDISEQFRTEPVTKCKKPRRPQNKDQQQAFLRVCGYLEDNDEEQLILYLTLHIE